jgi:hypothetical protein
MSFIDYLKNNTNKIIIENNNIDLVKNELLDQTDGPVTPFVVIARAIEISRKNKYPLVGIDDSIANALYEVLTDNFNMKSDIEIPSNEMPTRV